MGIRSGLLALLCTAAIACATPATPSPAPAPPPRTATLTPTELPLAATPTVAPVGPATALQNIPAAPERDSLDLAGRFLGVELTPLPDSALYPTEPVGTQRTFWAVDLRSTRMFEVAAELRHVSETALWYVSPDLRVGQDTLEETAHVFDGSILPHVVRNFGGGTAPPGRVTVLHAELPRVAGYFSGGDALPRSAYRFSNERMVLSINEPDEFGGESHLGTLAHELQHLVHWLVDPSEATWVNEGLAELAARSLGLGALPYGPYLEDPEVSLTDWPDSPRASLPNYAGGSLFSGYLASRFGLEAIHGLVAQRSDGADGVQAWLEAADLGTTFEEIYADWLVANVVSAESGRFAYADQPGTASVDRVLMGPGSTDATVHQLGAWYLRVGADGPLTVRFEGDTATPLIPAPPRSGEHYWWGNRGENIDATLTRELDLSGVTSATLRFWAWFRIEEGWDHGYVAVSADGGRSWQALVGSGSSLDDPLGTAVGPSYTGDSGGWREEMVDLSAYAGQRVLLRFEYVTDDAANGAGWCIDDISVAEVGLADDVESARNWEANGFVRVSSAGVEQRFLIRVIEGTGDGVSVTSVEPDERNSATFTAPASSVVVVTAIAPKTLVAARFRLEVTE